MTPGRLSAALGGAGVGLLGGLLGLGGAEFRLPLLVALFAYALRQAIPLSLAISFMAVIIAARVAVFSIRWTTPEARDAVVRQPTVGELGANDETESRVLDGPTPRPRHQV